MLVSCHSQTKRPAPTPSVATTVLQRKCACGRTPGPSGECAECQKKRKRALQRHRDHDSEPMTVPPIVHEVLATPGAPLDTATRASMEPRLGHDFSQVRVHTGARAAESARAVNALAYTVGRDVVFGAGNYAPSSTAGHRLLAHELAHVVQQRGADSTPGAGLEIGHADSRAEQEAEHIARGVGTARFATPLSAGPVPVQVQRQAPPVLPPMQVQTMTAEDQKALEAAQTARKNTLARGAKALVDLERALRAIGPTRTSDPAQYHRLWQAYASAIWPVMRWLKVEPGADFAEGKDVFLQAVVTARTGMQVNQRTTAPVEKIDDATGTCAADPSVQGFATGTEIKLCARAFACGVENLSEIVMHETFHLLGGIHGREIMQPGIPGCDLSPTPEAALLNPYCLTSLAYALSATPDVAAPRPLPMPSKPVTAGGAQASTPETAPKEEHAPVEVAIKLASETEQAREKGESKEEQTKKISAEVAITLPELKTGSVPVARAPLIFFGKLTLEGSFGAKSGTPEPGESPGPQGFGEFKISGALIRVEKDKLSGWPLLPPRSSAGFDISVIGAMGLKSSKEEANFGAETNLELKMPLFAKTPLFLFGKATATYRCESKEEGLHCSLSWGAGAGFGLTLGGGEK